MCEPLGHLYDVGHELQCGVAWCTPHTPSGYFRQGHINTKCVNTGAHEVNFVVRWLGPDGFILRDDDGCRTRLYAKILGCD